MATSQEKTQALHIAVFPWLAFGHMIPFLELAKFLALKGHKVSFISTPRNSERLENLTTSRISFVKIPLPKVPNLPREAEASTDLSNGEEMSLLKKAFDALEPEVRLFLEKSSPDWVICDFAQHWLPDITKRLKISCGYLNIMNARITAFCGPADDIIYGLDYRKCVEDFMVPPKWVKIKTNVAYRRFEAKWILQCGHENASGVSDYYRIGKVLEGCDAIFIRHCREFEPEWLSVVEELYHKPVIPIGLMPPRKDEIDNNGNDSNNKKWLFIKNWLDGHGKESVVYVALGSEVTLTQDQLTELAHGLEQSNVPFFWVQRNITSSSSNQLPDGFEERVSGRGIVWKSWAPQLKILSHSSVGGFLTHCGWSSVVEGLTFGHVLICLPFWVDTGLNARVISEKQLGVEIPRNEEDGSFARDDVAEAVKFVMVDGKGMKIKEEAKKATLMFGNFELHQLYLNDVVEFLETRSKTNYYI